MIKVGYQPTKQPVKQTNTHGTEYTMMPKEGQRLAYVGKSLGGDEVEGSPIKVEVEALVANAVLVLPRFRRYTEGVVSPFRWLENWSEKNDIQG